jgi:hypothetical protein
MLGGALAADLAETEWYATEMTVTGSEAVAADESTSESSAWTALPAISVPDSAPVAPAETMSRPAAVDSQLDLTFLAAVRPSTRAPLTPAWAAPSDTKLALPNVQIARQTGALPARMLPTPPAVGGSLQTVMPGNLIGQRPPSEGGNSRAVTGSDSGNSIALDGLGNSYITGSYWNGRDTDIFVSKVTPSGTILFTTVLPNPGTDSGNAIAIDTRGSAFVAGSRTNAAGDVEAVLVKFNRGGGFMQLTAIANPGPDSGNGVALGPGNNGYMTGSRWNGTDSDFFIVRFTATTAIVCDFTFPNPGTDAGNAVAVDGSFNAYVTGTFHFIGDNYLYLAKFDSACGLLNGTHIFNTGDNAGYGIAVDAAGEGYVTGTWWNGTDTDFIIARFDAALAFPNSFVYPNPGADRGNAVVFDSAFNAHVTGAFTFGADVYVYAAIFDSTCALLNGGFIFHVGEDRGMDIALGSAGNSFVTGAFDNGSHTDAFVAEFDPALVPVNQTFIPNSN